MEIKDITDPFYVGKTERIYNKNEYNTVSRQEVSPQIVNQFCLWLNKAHSKNEKLPEELADILE